MTDVRRERLDAITPEGVATEGFAGRTPQQFVQLFCALQKYTPDTVCTVIRWRYGKKEV